MVAWTIAGALLLALLALAPNTGADLRRVPLFFVARSKNANIVRYDARLSAPRALDVKQPIDAYWVMLATTRGRQELGWLERKLAYGVDATVTGPSEATIQLTAFPSRPVAVRLRDGRFHAETRIGGRDAVLERIYVQSDESGLVPKVLWVEVSGTDLKTGRQVTERVQH